GPAAPVVCPAVPGRLPTALPCPYTTLFRSELRVAEPLADLRILRRRTVLLANGVTLVVGIVTFSYLTLVPRLVAASPAVVHYGLDRKSTRLNSSHQIISYAVFCLKQPSLKA